MCADEPNKKVHKDQDEGHAVMMEEDWLLKRAEAFGQNTFKMGGRTALKTLPEKHIWRIMKMKSL